MPYVWTRCAAASFPLAAATIIAVPAPCQVPINSVKVAVVGYTYPSNSGEIIAYDVVGFKQPQGATGSGEKPRVFLLPTLRVPRSGVRFANSHGLTYSPTDCVAEPAGAITIELRASGSLPNDRQRPAIGAALAGDHKAQWLPIWPKDFLGKPEMWDRVSALPFAAAVIKPMFDSYEEAIKQQNEYIAAYKSFDISLATLNELSVELRVDNVVVARDLFNGSLVTAGAAPMLLGIKSPDPFICNRILQGEFQITARYRFNDTSSSKIKARFDSKQTLRKFIRETQVAVTSSKSSGWKVFGIGKRRSRLKTSMETSMESETDVGSIQDTTIVMYDPDDKMIEQFESVFFPALSKQQAIDNHTEAANAALAAGNPSLAKVHLDYAAALASGGEKLETDAIAAAAALSEGNYADFVARGVRATESDDSRTDNFRRTMEVGVTVQEAKIWDQAKTVTKQRESITTVNIGDRKVRADLGFYSSLPVTYTEVQKGCINCQHGKLRAGLMLGAINPSGPLRRAGILPGQIIIGVNGSEVKSLSELTAAVKDLKPGSIVSVETAWGFVNNPPGSTVIIIDGGTLDNSTRTYNVEVGSEPIIED